MVFLFGVMLLLMATISTDTALNLVTVTAPGSHMVGLATLGTLPHCVSSGRATIHYTPVVLCVLARGRPRCVIACDPGFGCAPVAWAPFSCIAVYCVPVSVSAFTRTRIVVVVVVVVVVVGRVSARRSRHSRTSVLLLSLAH